LYQTLNPCASEWEYRAVVYQDATFLAIDVLAAALPYIPGGGGIANVSARGAATMG